MKCFAVEVLFIKIMIFFAIEDLLIKIMICHAVEVLLTAMNFFVSRSILETKSDDRNADQVMTGDPRQVDRRILVKGPHKLNVTAFLQLRYGTRQESPLVQVS